jgi:solute:Na+ symporter, SSS family
VIIGALYVGGFGGAFEANKLFTGLFAIPMTIPLVFGILLRRPQPWGALLTIVVGIGLGLVLNAHPEISWEAATLIEISVCIGVFLASGLVESRNSAYLRRVDGFFTRLNTPLPESEKPREKPGFQQAMARLYAVSLGATGLLFMGMSLMSLSELSGQLSFASGVICQLLAAFMWYLGRRKAPATISHKVPESV